MMRLVTLIAVLSLVGCATPREPMDFTAFESASPRSILVVPTVNNSLDVDAPNYLLATLPMPLAEKGYYVFPVNTVKVVLELEGFYEGEQVHQQPAAVLANQFGADAVLFVTIDRWDAQYALITTTVTVALEYRMVARDGTEIWSASQTMAYTPSNSSSGSLLVDLIAAAVTAAVARAAPNYLPLTRQANQEVFILGHSAIPDGPYKNVGEGQ
jgi:hypothetical protein